MNQSIIPIIRFLEDYHPSPFLEWAQSANRHEAHQGHVQTLFVCLLIGMMGMAGLSPGGKRWRSTPSP
jgi:hypothetical protein